MAPVKPQARRSKDEPQSQGYRERTQMRVEVYRNLHNGMWSVRDCKTGRVVDHVDDIIIANPTFVVQPAGRKKVLEQKRKNVHAFVRGEAIEKTSRDRLLVSLLLSSYKQAEVTYNPYKYDSFVRKADETPVRQEAWAHLQGSTVTAYV